MSNVLVLDTSAIITLFQNEDGAAEVESLLRKGQKKSSLLYVSFITFMEVYYDSWRTYGQDKAIRAYLDLKTQPVTRVDINEDLILLAGEIKATNKLSVADSWIAATALTKNAILVHKDPEFEQLKDKIKLQALPYK